MFLLHVGFTGSYTQDEPNFLRQNNLISQQKVSSIDEFVNFKDISRPSEEIKYTFQGPKQNSRTFKDD